MQVQACKDKASSSVKVVALGGQSEKNRTDFDASITRQIDSRPSIVDENDRSRCLNHRDEPDSAVQIGLCTRTIACMNAIYSKHACYI